MLALSHVAGKQVWIVGDSIVRRAAYASAAGDVSPDGSIEVQWHGWGGLTLQDLPYRVSHLLRQASPPHWLIVHCGTNNLGRCSKGQTSRQLCKAISALHQLTPHTQVVWSAVLPRIIAPAGFSARTFDKLRRRLNSVASGFCGHKTIHHWDTPCDHFYTQDGLHLSNQGQDTFINNIGFYLHFRYFMDKL